MFAVYAEKFSTSDPLSGLVIGVRPDAQRRLYRLRPEPLMALDEWLEPYRAHWAGRLDALEQHLARTAIPVERPRPTDLTDHPTTEDQP